MRVIRWSPDTSSFFVLFRFKRVDRGFSFFVHEEYFGAVDLA